MPSFSMSIKKNGVQIFISMRGDFRQNRIMNKSITEQNSHFNIYRREKITSKRYDTYATKNTTHKNYNKKESLLTTVT